MAELTGYAQGVQLGLEPANVATLRSPRVVGEASKPCLPCLPKSLVGRHRSVSPSHPDRALLTGIYCSNSNQFQYSVIHAEHFKTARGLARKVEGEGDKIRLLGVER